MDESSYPKTKMLPCRYLPLGKCIHDECAAFYLDRYYRQYWDNSEKIKLKQEPWWLGGGYYQSEKSHYRRLHLCKAVEFIIPRCVASRKMLGEVIIANITDLDEWTEYADHDNYRDYHIQHLPTKVTEADAG